jgi:uncharacterized protein YbjT (DUF2867 family)
MYADQTRDTSEIMVPAGRSRTAFIDARDIGKVAAAVFTTPGHLRCAYTLSGERNLSYAAVARIMSQRLGRTITYSGTNEADYLAALAAHGCTGRLHRGTEDDLPRRTAQHLLPVQPRSSTPHM